MKIITVAGAECETTPAPSPIYVGLLETHR
jgi:hypothetical protein